MNLNAKNFVSLRTSVKIQVLPEYRVSKFKGKLNAVIMYMLMICKPMLKNNLAVPKNMEMVGSPKHIFTKILPWPDTFSEPV